MNEMVSLTVKVKLNESEHFVGIEGNNLILSGVPALYTFQEAKDIWKQSLIFGWNGTFTVHRVQIKLEDWPVIIDLQNQF